jgi:hypothetical protein
MSAPVSESETKFFTEIVIGISKWVGLSGEIFCQILEPLFFDVW